MAICRDCKHFDREVYRMKNGVLRFTTKPARCLFDGMERIQRKLPASYPSVGGASTLYTRMNSMRPTDGNGCPQWTQRPPEK